MQIAVKGVHPFATKISFNPESADISDKLPVERYAIIIIGITISFAGKARIKAISITPSSPKSVANGSRKSAQIASILLSPILMFAINQIIIPAGKATERERPKTKRVRSNTERTRTLKSWGFLNGGSSSV